MGSFIQRQKGLRLRANYSVDDWFFLSHESERKNLQIKTPDSIKFRSMLWPFSNDYVSTLNATLLSEIGSLERLSAVQTWFVRDGLIPLLWFFKLNPTPEKLRSRLLVHESFAQFVPEVWQKRVGTYRIAPRKRNPKASHLLLAGIICEEFCSPERLSEILSKVRARKSGSQSIYAYLPVRNLSVYKDGADYTPRYFRSVYETFGFDIKFVDYTFVSNQLSFTDWTMLQMNERLLLADDHLTHLVLGRGGDSMEAQPASMAKDEHWVPLSPSHGAVIRNSLAPVRSSARRPSKEIERYVLELMHSKAHRDFQWRDLLKGWQGTAPTTNAR